VFSPWSIYLYITSCCSTQLVLLFSICRDVNCSGIYSSFKNTFEIGHSFSLCYIFIQRRWISLTLAKDTLSFPHVSLVSLFNIRA
jgi:hypothetical protein